jgi:multicomponent Na+:H+ antiporter subunit A
MELLYIFLAIFPISFAVPFIVRKQSGWGWILSLIPATIFFMLLRLVPGISDGQVYEFSLDWIPTFGISMSLYLDGLSLFFALIISFIGILIIIYASGYFHHNSNVGRFYMIVLLFMGAMLGVVMAGNLFSMFVFWELTSLTSYLLIGFKHEQPESRWAALQSLLITGGGGLALFAGLILIRIITGSFDIADTLSNPDLIQSHNLYLPILLLVGIGAFTKSAQAPFHFWLVGAMAAPTPVSAYLHSATMVKAGIYLLARLSPVLGGTVEWHLIVTLMGGITMVLGAVLALPQFDLKKLLAYTTISALGMIVMLIGIGSSLAIKAAMVFLLVHSLYKGSLFMVAGGIDHVTGIRDVRTLSGLKQAMPLTAIAGLLAALSMAGIPPFFGFIGKELIYEAKLHTHNWTWLITVAGIFANSVNVTIAIVVGIFPFWGKINKIYEKEIMGPAGLWFGPLVAALLGLVFGLIPTLLAGSIFTPLISSILGKSYTVKLSLWHGFNIALLLSIVTVALGFLLFFLRKQFMLWPSKLQNVMRFSPTYIFKTGLDTSLRWFEKVTRLLQSGNLGQYLITIFSVVIITLWLQIIAGPWQTFNLNFDPVGILELTFAILMIAAAFVVVITKERLTAVIALGVIGYGIALIYLLFGAPDVAITQLVIETLTVVLFVLVLYRFPQFTGLSSKIARIRDIIIASLAGVFMFFLVLTKASGTSFKSISHYFVEQSVPKAHGHNIVNVILVDFRGLDTMGEITVLAVAAIGVYALLKLKPSAKDQ